MIGHFTAMVNWKQTHVGCALIKYKQSGFYRLQTTCNYAYTNVGRTRVYTVGAPCSECQTGCHQVFQGLCSDREVISVK